MDSTEEALATLAFQRKNRIQLVTNLALINAIMLSSDRIVAAIQHSDSMPGADKLNKIIEEMKQLLVPELVESNKEKEAKMEAQLKEIENMGPIKVRYDRGSKRKKV